MEEGAKKWIDEKLMPGARFFAPSGLNRRGEGKREDLFYGKSGHTERKRRGGKAPVPIKERGAVCICSDDTLKGGG